ncbi:hypothetical protein BGZ52_001384 [Haplosporangium bisporale]|nr:hypothetical protein BGZ52_001384 [Haplosporangium bisporale]
MTNGLGFATASDPVKVVTTADNQVLVYRPFGKYETSAKNLIKVYFRLLVNCVKDDMKAVAMGMIAMGAVLIAVRPEHVDRLKYVVFKRPPTLDSAAMFAAVAANATLTTLDLLCNAIGSKGAQALAEALMINLTLANLYLQDNPIGDNGAQALSQALKKNSSLTTLDLWGNSIGGSGAQALGKALKTNSTLATLDLQFNSIGENGAQALGEALKINSPLTTLDL